MFEILYRSNAFVEMYDKLVKYLAKQFQKLS
jgi:hypothetical protein